MRLSGRRLEGVEAGGRLRNNAISWSNALAIVFIVASQSKGDVQAA